ncbi:hypothetical protein HZB00_02980, partial [Candidatus Woesearchaeota archaeon]|nr:hypothetical protein [Candidatus Woesearchaeota archaeon]
KGNEFPFDPSYPLFWTQLVSYLSQQPELKDLNLKTGALYTGSNQNLILDKAGVFDLDGQKIAVNLLNEKESSINPQASIHTEISKFHLDSLIEEVRRSWIQWLLITALVFLFLEFFYTKYRGEL